VERYRGFQPDVTRRTLSRSLSIAPTGGRNGHMLGKRHDEAKTMFARLMRLMRERQLLPRISDTERQALEAGTVWIDGEIFSGRPNLRRIMAEPYSDLSPEERAFLEGPAETLCGMVDPYALETTRRVPDDAIEFIKSQGFMGLLIPREYGGKAFSTLAISAVLAKVQAHSASMGTIVVIPNSLGAAELLKYYGTDDQKSRYLPGLARGEYVPCFGLTELTAGSDAASIRAEGVVFADSDGTAKIRLNFSKRYITLAPIATLISLAFQLRDPDDLLGRGENPGITVALLHRDTPGLTLGDHHLPIGSGFYNGPISGQGVVIGTDAIIGGPAYAGQGWRMLMEQLAGGRAVSLPAGAVGLMKSIAAVTGAYSIVRRQFGMPIGYMEGVQEKVARIAAVAYLFEAARVFTCSAIDSGEQPPVISALLKASSTDYAQQVAIDAMDVFAGSGVMQGPNNIVGAAYTGAPVSVTVEGANIMTRTLIVFGQGATRCHPHALDLIRAVEADDVDAFRKHLLGWLGHTLANWARLKVLGLTRGFLASSPVSGPTATYHRRLAWASARFALLTDLAMYFIGSKLKARGSLSGRFADALTWQVLAFAALRRFEAEGRRPEDLPLVQYSCEYALARIQAAFEGIHDNFDAPLLGWWLRYPAGLFLRLNRLSSGPSDRLTPRAAATIQRLDDQYERLTAGIFRVTDTSSGKGRLLEAFRLNQRASPVLEKIASAQKARRLPRGPEYEAVDAALASGVISAAEAEQLRATRAAMLAACDVDVFPPDAYFRSSEPAARAMPQRGAAGHG
jgi:acyl-CoA dehydrogenase